MNNISYPLINMSNIINGIKSLRSVGTKILTLPELNLNCQEEKIHFLKEIKLSN